jgi:hypothetical protein
MYALNHYYPFQFDVSLLGPTLASAKSHHGASLKYLFARNPWNCGCDTLKTVQVSIYVIRMNEC